MSLAFSHGLNQVVLAPFAGEVGFFPSKDEILIYLRAIHSHALVPQPGNHSTPPRPGSGPEGGGPSGGGGPNPTRNSPNQAGPSGLFHSLFSNLSSQSNSNSNNTSGNNGGRSQDHHLRSSSSSSSRPRPPSSRRRSGPPHSPRENDGRGHFPGSWAEQMD